MSNVKVSLPSLLRALIAVAVCVPASAKAFSDASAKNVGFDTQSFGDDFQGIASGIGLVDSIINIINALLVLAAIAAIVSIIAAVIPRGADEEAAERAKNALLYSIVGIIVIILAAVFVNFFLVQII